MDAAIKNRLLASIDSNRLILLCGAGLSMADPSRLPSARTVAQACFDKYQLRDPECPKALREDLESLAEYFASLRLLPYFIAEVVPWELFNRQPNAGHAAIADLLTTKAAFAAISSNYDTMIEDYARTRRSDLYASLDGDAAARVHRHSPLLKFHGCSTKDREATVWTKSQLGTEPITGRIARTKTWLAANLREKDLVVVGFWSDWGYLNEVFDAAFEDSGPRSIVVVDPAPQEFLREKAPKLWDIANGPGIQFNHISASGADFLAELRLEFSNGFMRKVFAAGRQAFETETGAECDPAWLAATFADNEDVYEFRRDCEGRPSPGPATAKEPVGGELLGMFHLLLRSSGATTIPGGYSLRGKSIRIVNGANRLMSAVKSDFKEPPSLASAFDVVACIGAEDSPLPGNVIRGGKSGHILHPAAGGTWLTYSQSRTDLGI